MASSDIVIDASVVVKWLFRNEPYRAKAKNLLTDYTKRKINLIAPNLLVYKIESFVQSKLKNGLLTLNEANLSLEKFYKLDIPIERDASLVDKAREIARLTRQERIYDSLYAALAELRGCEFWTADRAFYEAAKRQLASVQFLADYN